MVLLPVNPEAVIAPLSWSVAPAVAEVMFPIEPEKPTTSAPNLTLLKPTLIVLLLPVDRAIAFIVRVPVPV